MAFQQGLSGLNASSKGLDVVGNNIANSSTVGFKSSNAHFADVYAASLNNVGTSQVGIGVMLASVFQQFNQSDISSTSNSLDIAINGGGFFNVTRDGLVAYTRNGQFHTDNQGYIVNDQDYRLMGYLATASGEILMSQPGEIRVDTSNIAPQPTGSANGGNATMVANLDSSKDAITATFSPTDPSTYTYSTAQTVYDTLGVEHNVIYYFVKTDPAVTPGQWDLYATLDGDPDTEAQMTSLTFDTNGQLTTTMPLDMPDTWDITTGAETPLGYSQGTLLPNWKIDFTGTTSFSGESTVNSQTQGGYGQGALSSLSIGSDGILMGNYSNGKTKKLAQIVLTTFPNMNGLINAGNNLFQASSASGEGLVGVPGAGARGVLRSFAVEESNVDLTNELVNMITLQRNYQANAQTIKTQDSIMQTLVNLR